MRILTRVWRFFVGKQDTVHLLPPLLRILIRMCLLSAFQPALSHWCYAFLRNRNVVGRFFTVYQRMEMLIDVLIDCLLILERLIATRAWEDFVVSVKMRSGNQLVYGGNASWGLKNSSLAPHYQTV